MHRGIALLCEGSTPYLFEIFIIRMTVSGEPTKVETGAGKNPGMWCGL